MPTEYYIFWTAITVLFLITTTVLIWQLHRIAHELDYIEENTRPQP
jgi:hypothetical protein